MRVTASMIRKAMAETGMEIVAESAAGAARLAGQKIDVSKWAMSRADKLTDQHHKARALARVAGAVSEADLDDQAMRLLISAFLTARLAGRTAVLDVLAHGAELIAKTDQGKTLLHVYDEFLAVDQWLAPPSEKT